MLKQTELIKSALNELGCEEAPSACDLSIDNQTFISNTSEQVNNILYIFYISVYISLIYESIVTTKSEQIMKSVYFY